MRHRFHAICPYFAMFPESFVDKWVGMLTKPGDLVLDPFCGRGTTPFQSLLMDRRAVGSDINPVAFCVTKAKTNAPPAPSVKCRLTTLKKAYDSSEWSEAVEAMPEFYHFCYQPNTLCQLLYLRSVLKWEKNPTDCMIAALILGILHGESERSPSYLSNQMPRTISTKPAYSVRWWQKKGYTAPERDVFAMLRRATDFRYASDPPAIQAKILNIDMRRLPYNTSSIEGDVRLAVTSPPYLNVTSFEEDQWLRLWFLGGPPHPTRNRISLDDRHSGSASYWSFICDMWRVFGDVMAKDSHVVVRLGARKLSPEQIVDQLEGSSRFAGRPVQLVEWEQSSLEKKRQTRAFRPGSKGCTDEVDCHFIFS